MELLERASFLQMLASHADEARRREGRLVLSRSLDLKSEQAAIAASERELQTIDGK
jgi:hypothetical protein